MIDLPERPADLTRVRLFIAFIACGLMAIVARLWYLQIAHGDELQLASLTNQRRLIRRVPPRGQIEDREGRLLAINHQQWAVSIVPNEIKKNPDVLPLLSSLLDKPVEELEAILSNQAKQGGAFDSVVVDDDVSMEVVTRLEEQRLSLPGVDVGPQPVRYYPDKDLFGHILGQMGQITPEELKKRRDEGYRAGDFCGKLGLERGYDAVLRGTNGGREIEVDARGRVRGEVSNNAPVSGSTLTLTLDKTLQKLAYEELAARQKNGAVVALDPKTGAVLALVSYPSYDPNMYVRGISVADLKRLNEDPRKPQINRAVYTASAPGSTFKMMTAIAGLETGNATPRSGDYCSGYISLGRWKKHCHKASGHGYVDFTDALAKSCDVFYYHLGQRLTPEVMADYARKFGLGSKLGIDLPLVEKAGIVPTPAYKEKHHRVWVGGDTVDTAIGQGELACTPLQMCSMVAAIANGGTVYRPQLIKTITEYDLGGGKKIAHRFNPEIVRKAGVSQNNLQIIIRAMEAVMQPGGTGAHSAIPGLRIAGKTGTAQRHNKIDNAWYVGFAPIEDPKIAICVYVEEGGHGGETAAPIARKLFGAFFHLALDAQTDPVSTLD